MFTFSLLLVWIIFIQTYIVKTIASFIKYLKSPKNKNNYTKLLFDCIKLYISIISFYLINHYVYLYQITVGLFSIKLFIFALFLTIFFLLIFILICCILNDLIEKIKSENDLYIIIMEVNKWRISNLTVKNSKSSITGQL